VVEEIVVVVTGTVVLVEVLVVLVTMTVVLVEVIVVVVTGAVVLVAAPVEVVTGAVVLVELELVTIVLVEVIGRLEVVLGFVPPIVVEVEDEVEELLSSPGFVVLVEESSSDFNVVVVVDSSVAKVVEVLDLRSTTSFSTKAELSLLEHAAVMIKRQSNADLKKNLISRLRVFSKTIFVLNSDRIDYRAFLTKVLIGSIGGSIECCPSVGIHLISRQKP
jgi:hypothetical protein